MKISATSQVPLFFLLLLLSLVTSQNPSNSYQQFFECLARYSPPSASSISQVLYTPQNASYDSVLYSSIRNLRYATSTTPKPLAIVTPMQDSQIQTLIYCSKKHEIQMRIRGGGHDYEGLSYVSKVPFVLLDMIYYRSIYVDAVAATAWVQSGATLGQLYYSIAEKSSTLAFPGGVWYTVGVTGLISGGGYGHLRRKYGLAADNVIDARLIDVNGRILDRQTMGEDLFWAIRGGGASSFGVILSWKLKLVYVPEIITTFQVDKTLEQNGSEIFYKWQLIAPKLPKDVDLRASALPQWKNIPNPQIGTVLNSGNRSNEAEKTVSIQFIGTFLGPRDKFIALMSESFPELGLKLEDCREVSNIQVLLLSSLFSPYDSPTELLSRASPTIAFKAKSAFVETPISRDDLNGLWQLLLQTNPPTSLIRFTSYGGMMDEIPESAIPFPHRAGTLYMVYMRVSTDGDVAKSLRWIRNLYKYVIPYMNPIQTAYVNYNDLDLGVNNQYGPTSYEQASKWGRKYFKRNLDRLVAVKSMVDPENFFRHEQSIPPLQI
ncbi:Berberine bridge enzyme [Heracleum sosnowskyi]|uniref:Berberine bridge enzyme n=1 Tax=Heracleum sosnowskyi TaxID=360622 RepID=A0AAD8JG75_9APIA|nr:Berberine bridge enzyme [Heracleum sosnowskyi]